MDRAGEAVDVAFMVLDRARLQAPQPNLAAFNPGNVILYHARWLKAALKPDRPRRPLAAGLTTEATTFI